MSLPMALQQLAKRAPTEKSAVYARDEPAAKRIRGSVAAPILITDSPDVDSAYEEDQRALEEQEQRMVQVWQRALSVATRHLAAGQCGLPLLTRRGSAGLRKLLRIVSHLSLVLSHRHSCLRSLSASQEQDELEARTHVSDTLDLDSKVESCAAPEASGTLVEASSPELSDEQVCKASRSTAKLQGGVEL